MKSGNVENFKDMSNFRDIHDFNNQIEQWMVELKTQFTKSELAALKRLIRFSAKVAGICHAKIGTLVAATHAKDAAGISRSTFKRMAGKARNFGLLEIHETERKNGSQTANLYVFNRFEPPNMQKLNQPKTNNLSKTSKIKNIKTRNNVDCIGEPHETSPNQIGDVKKELNLQSENHEQGYQRIAVQQAGDRIEIIQKGRLQFAECQNQIAKLDADHSGSIKQNDGPSQEVLPSGNIEMPLDSTFVSERVPNDFTHLVKCFFNDAKTIEEYWRIVRITAKKHKIEGDIIGTALQAFKMLIRKMKMDRVKNPFGFYYGMLDKKFHILHFRELSEAFWNS
ncbi:hypothetical protein [Peribacillus sp. SCS-155]|uniref:hypothetical protein n=1 Tax=Peribacillus sedimenti TaxID=3115297 RepID=UPI0039066291